MHLRVNDLTAEVEPLNEEGKTLIRVLRLNDREQIDERRKGLAVLKNLARSDVELWEKMMAFPDHLHDLGRREPPQGNSRPEGIRDSCHERRLRGELPDWYEE